MRFPLIKHSNGGCSGFGPDSLLIDAAQSPSNRMLAYVQLYVIIVARRGVCVKVIVRKGKDRRSCDLRSGMWGYFCSAALTGR